MNIKEVLSLVAGVAYAASSIYYIIGVIRGKIKPNVGSFLIWSFVNTSLLVSLISSNAWNSVPFAAVAMANSMTVSFLALKYRKFYFSRIDAVSFALAFFGVILWLITSQAEWNIYVIAVVNTLTLIPIVTKSIKFPQYEDPLPWRWNFLGALLLVASIPSLAVKDWIIPLQQFVCSIMINIVLTETFRRAPKQATNP